MNGFLVPNKLLHAIAIMVLTVCTGNLVQAEDENTEDEPVNVVPSEIIDIISFKADVVRTVKMYQYLRQLSGQDELDGMISDILDEVVSMGLVAERDSANLLYDVSLAYPQYAPLFVVVTPMTAEQVQEEILDEDKRVQVDGEVHEYDDIALLVTENYVALAGDDGDNITFPNRDARIKQAFHETKNARHSKLASLSSRPRDIGKSGLRTFFNGIRATLLADAQRRDDDSDIDHVGRSLVQRSQVELLDLFFNDIEEVEYSLDWSENDKSMTVELRIVAHEDSGLDQYIARVRKSGNRSLAWLHPDHSSFATMSVSIPKLFSESSDQIAAALPDFLQDSLLLSNGAAQQTQAAFDAFVQNGSIEHLVQIIPTDEDSSIAVGITPFSEGLSLSPAVSELVNAIDDPTQLTTVTDIGGWPVYKSHDFGGEFYGKRCDAYVTITDNSFAWMIGTDDDISVFEDVVLREYSPDEAGNRFRRAAFGMQMELPRNGSDQLALGFRIW